MKKYISILLAAVLCSSILAGCGGSGSSGQKPAAETQEQATQTEGTEEAQPTEDAAQTGGTEEARPSEDAAQADVTKEEASPSEDTAQDSTQAAADGARWARRMRADWPRSIQKIPERIQYT